MEIPDEDDDTLFQELMACTPGVPSRILEPPVPLSYLAYHGCDPGILLTIRRKDGSTQELLVGHVNGAIGVCDCCPYDRDGLVIALRRIWRQT